VCYFWFAGALQAKFAAQGQQQAFGQLSQGEQAAALASANPQVFEELAALNKAYKAMHGFIFIICASGKSAPEMLEAIKARINNSPYAELGAAAREQMKITQLRLEKLLAGNVSGSSSSGSSSPAERAHVRTGQLVGHLMPAAAAAAAAAAAGGAHCGPLRSPITTHVLDTALGMPAAGLPISLLRMMDGSAAVYDCLASGVTDADGRIGNLLPASAWVAPGNYRMRFDTGAYLRVCR
jgi:5-hydroxyisourate hydrolase/2-oxo-4-hydroxy-4-carboxy-5-ureidoimidazoline decarboxylase